MKTHVNVSLPLNFDQVIDLVRQLPYKEKIKLAEILKKEAIPHPENMTHFVSEKILAKDWLLLEENETWKDL